MGNNPTAWHVYFSCSDSMHYGRIVNPQSLLCPGASLEITPSSQRRPPLAVSGCRMGSAVLTPTAGKDTGPALCPRNGSHTVSAPGVWKVLCGTKATSIALPTDGERRLSPNPEPHAGTQNPRVRRRLPLQAACQLLPLCLCWALLTPCQCTPLKKQLGLHVSSTSSQGEALWDVEGEGNWRPGPAWLTPQGQVLPPFPGALNPCSSQTGGRGRGHPESLTGLSHDKVTQT